MKTKATKPKRVLIIDDDPSIIKAALRYFSDASPRYDLWSAPEGQVALQLALEKLPDLIITDWQMPGLNGIEVMQQLQALEATKHIPVIITTGVNKQDTHLERALEAGAIDYLRKPFSKIELLARARTALRLAELHKREKELMQSVIDHKDRELSSIMVQVVQKNKLLANIQQKLDQVSTMYTAATPLQSLSKTIRENLQSDSDWEKFKLHFEQVHPNFFTHLKNEFGSLTANDLKLCAYLRINLTNKDIGQLLNISYKGVETAYYRIKKKLKLSAQEKLRDFIQQH
ncbi:hypothetical protein BKI52_18500 [marine bacterium AO1-C]|nr:hypothetical protein BKI52_18500 [marine bacterium AO1-C]